MKEKIRRILRDFWNDSCYTLDKKRFAPHAGNDLNCKLCQIETKVIQKIENLTKHNSSSKKDCSKIICEMCGEEAFQVFCDKCVSKIRSPS